MPVVVLQSAKDDLRDGYLFYERQGGSYLGNYFLATLQGELSSLALYAGIHNQRFGFYRALSRRFPYSIEQLRGQSPVVGFLTCRLSMSFETTPS